MWARYFRSLTDAPLPTSLDQLLILLLLYVSKCGLSEPDVQEARIGRSQHALMEITCLHTMKAMGGCVFHFRWTVMFSVDVAMHWYGWTLEESRSTFAANIE